MGRGESSLPPTVGHVCFVHCQILSMSGRLAVPWVHAPDGWKLVWMFPGVERSVHHVSLLAKPGAVFAFRCKFLLGEGGAFS